MKTKQVSEKWGISDRRIRLLCSEGKIEGAELVFSYASAKISAIMN